jgi:NTP pyrophosphatase (non-canonical NTP hydrolase)
MTIKQLSEEVEKVSQDYTDKFSIERDTSWFVLKLQEEMGELVQSYLMLSGKARTKGKTEKELKEDFAKEVADVFSHILLLAKHTHVDIEHEVTEKWLVWNKK